MKIDWFTVIAQVVNFLVLVWLLKRFLYKPILNAIDERETKIADQLKDAAAKKVEAQKEQDAFTKKNELFDAEKNENLEKAVQDAKKEKEKLMKEAREAYDILRSKQDKAIAEMQENMNLEVRQQIQEEVFAISAKALNDLASLGLESQIVAVFIEKLKTLNEDEKKKFTDAFNKGSQKVIIRSAFDLTTQQQSDLNKLIDAILVEKTSVEFKSSPEIIGGIELSSEAFKLSWSISEYLKSMHHKVSEKAQ